MRVLYAVQLFDAFDVSMCVYYVRRKARGDVLTKSTTHDGGYARMRLLAARGVLFPLAATPPARH